MLESQRSRFACGWLLVAALTASEPAHAIQLSDENDTEQPAVSEEEANENATPSAETPPARRPPLTSEAADRAVRAEIEKGTLGFCTNPRERLTSADERLCKLADAASARCPEFRAACTRIDQTADPSHESTAKKPSSKEASKAAPAAVSFLAQIVFWTLFAIGLVFLITVIVKNQVKSRTRMTEPPDEPTPDAKGDTPALRPSTETDAQRLLARARANAGRGDYREALADAYAALLRHLDQRGLIELHSARTNGDYVRSLAEHPELQKTLGEAVRDVERVQFGSSVPTAELFESLFSRVVPLVAKSAAVLLSISLLLSSTGCQSYDGDTGSAELGAWSHSPRGLALLRELALTHGSVLRNRIPSLERIEPEVDAIILLDIALDPVERASLWSFVERGGLLVVASGTDELERRVGARPIYSECKGELVLEPSYRAAELFGDKLALRATPNRALEPSSAEHWVVARCGSKPYVLAGERGQGTLLVLPNADLLSNASLVTADNAFFVLGLLGDARNIDVVGRWTGAGSSTPFAAIKNTKLVPVLLQLLILLLVVFAWRGTRFAQPRDPAERSRRAFAEHVRALGLVYARARATRLALANYAAWALDRLRERLEPGSDPSLHRLAAAIAARTGRPEGEVMRVLVEARSARDDPARDTSTPEDLQTMRDLDQLVAALQLGRAVPR